jgi:hypothetical protein
MDLKQFIASDHQETIRVDSGDTPEGDRLWEAKLAYFKTLNYSFEKDQQKAIREQIKCEHEGCNRIAESRCISCLMNRSGNHWFCRPFRLLDIEGYRYCNRNLRITYDNSHSFAHDHEFHPTKSFWKYTIKEVKNDTLSL